MVKIFLRLFRPLLAAAVGSLALTAYAADPVVEASVMANASTGRFAPYYISSLRHGKVTQKSGVLVDALYLQPLDSARRLSLGYGAEMIAGATARNAYSYFDATDHSWQTHRLGPAPLWIQQLYAEAKHRAVYLMAGLKEQQSPLIHNSLTSGDLVESGNSRPVPQLRAGFIDFVDVPFTQGWVQINGAVAYGLMPDDRYMRRHYNHYNYHIVADALYNYKFCYFRSNPAQRLSVTAGMQSAGMFGGTSTTYMSGRVTEVTKYDVNAKSFFNMLLPVFNSANKFAEGSTIGSWDFHARYRLRDGSQLGAYFQWPFEDGSGIARRNKMDGLYGIEYRASSPGFITEAVVEYLDTRDQSGPIHFAPGDYDIPGMDTEATGRDNYYNNGFYNSYAVYGMSMGTPLLLSPIYNLDGYPAFACNRVQALHLGLAGSLSARLSYRAMVGWQRGLGTYDEPFHGPRHDMSVYIEGCYGLSQRSLVKVQLACDRGELRGNNFGTLLSFTYRPWL